MTDSPLHIHTPQDLWAKVSKLIFKAPARATIEDAGPGPLCVPKGPFSRVIEYWDALDKAHKIPMACSFDLLALPQLVQNVTLFEIDGHRFRIRFVGTGIVQEIGQDTTGRYLDEMPNMTPVQDRAFNCTRSRQPYFHENLPVTWTSRDFVTYSTLGLPLSDEDGNITQIAFLMIFN